MDTRDILDHLRGRGISGETGRAQELLASSHLVTWRDGDTDCAAIGGELSPRARIGALADVLLAFPDASSLTIVLGSGEASHTVLLAYRTLLPRIQRRIELALDFIPLAELPAQSSSTTPGTEARPPARNDASEADRLRAGLIARIERGEARVQKLEFVASHVATPWSGASLFDPIPVILRDGDAPVVVEVEATTGGRFSEHFRHAVVAAALNTAWLTESASSAEWVLAGHRKSLLLRPTSPASLGSCSLRPPQRTESTSTSGSSPREPILARARQPRDEAFSDGLLERALDPSKSRALVAHPKLTSARGRERLPRFLAMARSLGVDLATITG